MNFDTWYDLYSYPYESREDAAERYIEEQGVDDPAEKQGFLDSLPEYREVDVQKERQQYTPLTFGDYTPTPIDLPDPEYVDDPDWWDQLKAGADEATASGASALAGPVSGFLSEYVSEDIGEGLKGWAEDWRDANLAEAAQVKRPETREEILARDPDSWYKYTPEFFPTGHEIVRSTPTSLAAAGIALPAAVVAGKAAGVVGLAALGKMAVGAGTGMVAGNVASSLQVAGEAYERAKNDPVIREELGVDPNKDFKDLLPEDQQKIDRFATDLSQSSFGHRLYTSGLLEMASFIPYGPILGRWALDTGLGTTSELMDRELYAEDAADKLVEYGLPRERALELQEKMLNLGPSEQETFIKALVQEGIMGGGFSAFESITGASDYRVNIPATGTRAVEKQHEEMNKELDKQLFKYRTQLMLPHTATWDDVKVALDNKRGVEDEKAEVDNFKRMNDLTNQGALDEAAIEEGFVDDADRKTQLKIREQKIKESKISDVERDRLTLEEAENEAVDEARRSLTEAEARHLSALQGNKLRQALKHLYDARDKRVRKAYLEILKERPFTEASNALKEAKLAAKETLDKPGFLRTAEEKITVADLRKQEEALDAKFPLRTQEEEQVQMMEEAEARVGPRFAKIKNDTGKPTKFEKVKQVFGWTTKPKKELGKVKLSKGITKALFLDLVKRNPQYKGKFEIVNKEDVDAVAQAFTDGGRTVWDAKLNEGKGGERKAKKEENTAYAKDALENARAWTFGNKIFINADVISGPTRSSVTKQLVELGMFHEPIAHIGLKNYLGDDYKGFLDNFYKTNERDIKLWVNKEAKNYLSEVDDINNLRDSEKQLLAEEFLANKFVEFGVRDPNIIARVADQLVSSAYKALGRRRISTVEARTILAEIQRDYIGGERNIITGDFFDRSNWLKSKAKPDSQIKEDEEKKDLLYRTKQVEGAREPRTVKGKPIVEEAKVKPETTTTQRPRQVGPAPAPEKTGPQKVMFAKRVSTPKKRELWQKTHKPNPVQEIKRRDEDLKKLAKDLEKGKITFEEYRSKYEKVHPIRTFDTVPKLSSMTEIAGAINQGQYDKGKLIGEDSDLKAGMRANVRFDVDSMNKYNVGVVTAVSPEAKGSHYGRAAHLAPLKDGTPVKMITNQKKGTLKIATGEGKFPMAFLKGIWKGTSAAQIKVKAQKALKDPNWIQVGMNPTRQSSFYARETKIINGKSIEAGTPIATAEEVLQVGMFVIAKNPTTQAVPTFTSAEGKEVRFAKAWHGSPHTFDRFTTGMIGTGEGAQARGWGLYFTAKKEVGEWYKENLSQLAEPEYTQDDLKDYWKKGNVIQLPLTGQLVPWKSIEPIIPLLAEQHGMRPNDYSATISVDNMPEAIVEKINKKPNGNIKSVQIQEVKRMTRQEDKYGDGRVTETEFFETVGNPITIPVYDPPAYEFTDIVGRKASTKAKLYEVDIAPKDNEYLHLDIPLKDQSKKVEGAAKKIVGKWVEKELIEAKNDPRYFTRTKKGRNEWKDIYANMTGDMFVDWIQNKFDGSRSEQAMMASQYLLYHGVRGNKYYTGETRNKNKKDFNYVIFDEKDVTIQARFAKVRQTGRKLESEWGVVVKPDTDEPTVGININDKTQDFTGQILSGRKTIETRDTDSLRAYVGKEVGIIRTGKGKAQVVGYMTVGEPVVYNNRAEFKKDHSKHLVKTGSDFDIRAGKTKYGYPLTNVRKVAPFPVTTKGMVARKITSPDPVSRAMSRIMGLAEKGKTTNPEEIIIGKTAVKIKPDMDGKSLWWSSMRAFEKGKGEGTKTMNKILKIAKEEKVDIIAHAKAFEEGGPTTPQLRKWYRRLGFEDHTQGRIIFRKPTVIHLTGKSRMKTIDMFDDVRFAKRVDQPTAKELEAEWTKKSAKVKPDTKIPKDKVSLGNKKFTTGTYVKQDLGWKKILNPDGNVRSSRVMMGNAAAHAIGTRSWNPLTRWTEKTQPFADKLLERMIAQGTLPDSAKYKDLRRLLKGAIYKAEQGGKMLYDALANSKQKDVLFKYFTTKGYNANLITDRAERQAAIEAKEEIHKIGKELVDRNLLHEAAFKELEGAYLPRVYLKYLLGEKNFNNVRAGATLDMKYLEGRKDIPEGVRKLLMHEVEDPAYLGSKAIGIPRTDMAILDFLQQIALNPKWVLPQSMVTFDVYGELRNLAVENNLSKGIIDSLKSNIGLLDTKKNMVSAHWLNTEATRIRKTAPDAGLSVEERKTLDELTEKMMKASEGKTNENWEKYDSDNFRQIPKSIKYGSLAGMVVRKEIASDLFGGMNVATGDISTAEAILGDGGIIGDYNRLWKWAKVSANPPSWVRNFVSNMILMNMGGVPVGRMPDLILSSLADMRKGGKHKGRLHQLAKDLGLTAGTFSNVELGRIEKEFKDLQRRMQSKKSAPWAVFGAIKGAFNKVRDVTGDIYGGIDSLGKMMMLRYYMDQKNLDIKDISKYKGKELNNLHEIATQAEKWLFDYSNVLPSVKWLRRAPLGAPFMSFTSFVAPLMLETAITKPWKFAPYYAIGWGMKEWFKNNFDLDDEDLEALKIGLSDYLREKAKESIFPTGVIPLPFLDENKRVQWLDISYLYPWGMFSEMAGEIADGQIGEAIKTAGLMGSPLFNIASAVSTGIDPFSRKEIVDPMGTPTEQAMDIWWYAFNLTMPPFMHGAGWGNDGFGAALRVYDAFMGNLAKDGEAKFTILQASLRAAGINITPLAVPEGATKQLKFEQSKIRKMIYNAERDIKNMVMMMKSQSEIQEAIKDYRTKIIARVQEWKDKVRRSIPPESIAKPRRQNVRERLLAFQRQRASERGQRQV